MCVRVHVRFRVFVRVSVFVSVSAFASASVCVCACACACVLVWVFAWQVLVRVRYFVSVLFCVVLSRGFCGSLVWRGLREVAPVCSIAPWISSAHPPLLHPRVVLMISKSTLLPPLFPRQMSPRYLNARHCQEIMFPTWLLLPPSRQISLRSLG